jgi:histidine triad (HIT) family protein
MDPACVFCRISTGQAEASLVYQDDSVTAFMDILPVNTGHLLVVPNRHTPDLAGLDEATGGRMFGVAVRMAQALRVVGVPCEGVNLYLADGRAAGQEVLHVHLHVLPRFAGDGFGLRRSKRLDRISRTELDAVAARIRSAIAA